MVLLTVDCCRLGQLDEDHETKDEAPPIHLDLDLDLARKRGALASFLKI